MEKKQDSEETLQRKLDENEECSSGDDVRDLFVKDKVF